MRVVNLFADPDDWFDDNLMQPILQLFRAAEHPRDACVDMWKLDLSGSFGDRYTAEILQWIDAAYTLSLQFFPRLDVLLDRIIVIPAQADGDLVRSLDGVGGFAFKNDLILYISPSVPRWKDALFHAAIHEINHVVRQDFFDPNEMFLEWMVMEGMAEVFIAEQFPAKVLPKWVTTCRDADVQRFLPQLCEFWRQSHHSIPHAREWFYGSESKNIPKWLGYATGFKLVGTMRSKCRNEAWDKFITRSAFDFIEDFPAPTS
jgi:uncharacterized protein YjaZ